MQLTYVEFELLRTLASNPGRVFSRRQPLEALWGDSAYREPRTIDVHVRHLREEARTRRQRAGVHPHRSRRGLPLPGYLMRLRTVGLKLSLALIALVAGALAVVYIAVVPTLKEGLVDGRLAQLERPRTRSSPTAQDGLDPVLFEDFVAGESQTRGPGWPSTAT